MHATNAAMGQPQNWSFRALAARSGPSELEKDAARLVRQRKISKQVEKQVAPLAYNAVVQVCSACQQRLLQSFLYCRWVTVNQSLGGCCMS